MEKLVNMLKRNNNTISSMESCTGGLFANELTNIDGASNVFNLGLVTYSNKYKEYFGVSKRTINKFGVYSIETAQEMARVVTNIANSDFGIGITGMLGRKDPNNKSGRIDIVYISVFDKEKGINYDYEIKAEGKSRLDKKIFVINFIKDKLYKICK